MRQLGISRGGFLAGPPSDVRAPPHREVYHICLYLYSSISLSLSIYIYIYVDIDIDIDICYIYIYIYIYTHTYTYMYIHIYIYMYIHSTYIYIYIHIDRYLPRKRNLGAPWNAGGGLLRRYPFWRTFRLRRHSSGSSEAPWHAHNLRLAITNARAVIAICTWIWSSNRVK